MSRWKKGICLGVIGVLLIGGVSFALLPQLLSTTWGKALFINYLKRRFEITLTVDELSLSWSKGQIVNKMSAAKEGVFDFRFEHLQTDCSFWNLLRRRGFVGKSELFKPTLSLEQSFEKEQKGEAFSWEHLQGTLSLKQGEFFLLRQGARSMAIEVTSCKVSLNQELAFYGRGITTLSDQSGTFFFDIKKQENRLSGKAAFEAFPIKGIATLLSPFLSQTAHTILQSLGKSLNLDLAARNQGKGSVIDLKAYTPMLNASIGFFYQEGAFSLTRTATLKWSVTPPLFAKLMRAFSLPLTLTKNAALLCELTSGKADSQALMRGELFDSEGAFSINQTALNFKGTPITLSLLSGSFKSLVAKKSAELTVAARGKYGSLANTTVRLSAAAQEITGRKSFRLTSLKADIEKGPLALIDIWQKKASQLTSWLGTTFDLSAQWSFPENLTVSGSTPFASLGKSVWMLNKALKLKVPVSFSYSLPANRLDSFSPPINVFGQLNSLDIPLKGRALDWKQAVVALDLKSEKIALKEMPFLGKVTYQDIALDLKSPSPGTGEFTLTSSLIPKENSLISALLGSNGSLTLRGELDWRSKLNQIPLTLDFKSKALKTTLFATLQKQSIELKKNALIHFELSPTLVNSLLAKRESPVSLLDKAPLTITLTKGFFPISPSKAPWRLRGDIASSTLPLTTTQGSHPFTLKNVSGSFSLDQVIAFHLKGALEENAGPAGEFDATWKHGQVETLDLKLRQFSTPLADALTLKSGKLLPIIGQTFDLDVNSSLSKKHQTAQFKFLSNLLSIEGRGKVANGMLTDDHEPLKIAWTLTNRGLHAFKTLRGSTLTPLFSLEKPIKLTSMISTFSLPLTEKKGAWPALDWNLYQMGFDGTFNLDQLQLTSASQTGLTQTTTHGELNLKATKEPQGGKLSFDFSGTVLAKQRGTLEGRGELNNAFTARGAFDPNDLSASIDVKLKNVPTLAIDALTHLLSPNSTPPSLILGEKVSGTLHTLIKNDQGTLDTNLDASGCQTRVVGMIDRGIFTLKEPLRATLTITPNLNAQLTKTAQLEIVSTSKPISLYIDQAGFSVPLKDLHMRSITLPYGRLNFHQVVCRNRGKASDLSELFKINPFKSSLTSLWFAPMEFRIAQGKLLIDRTEMLYNRTYQIALWGEINYQSRFVSMMLGLTAQSLQAALNIRGLSSNYVLAIPIRGPFGAVQLDKKAAASKIAFLIARKQIAPQLGRWGDLFDAFGDLTDGQSNIPPPKPPFPWQK